MECETSLKCLLFPCSNHWSINTRAGKLCFSSAYLVPCPSWSRIYVMFYEFIALTIPHSYKKDSPLLRLYLVTGLVWSFVCTCTNGSWLHPHMTGHSHEGKASQLPCLWRLHTTGPSVTSPVPQSVRNLARWVRLALPPSLVQEAATCWVRNHNVQAPDPRSCAVQTMALFSR